MKKQKRKKTSHQRTIELEVFARKLRESIRKNEATLIKIAARLKKADPTSKRVKGLRDSLRQLERAITRSKTKLKDVIRAKRQLDDDRKKYHEGNLKNKIRWRDTNREINNELREQLSLLEGLQNFSVTFGESTHEDTPSHDLFLSHAHEDKETVAEPLANLLSSNGLTVWYDEFSLSVGDSLRKSIDFGLANSRFGIAILSSAFFAKNWTQYELNGLVAKEMEGEKVILPVWHNLTKDDLLKYSPTLVDRVALNTSIHSLQEIADKIADAVRSAE